MTHEVSDVHQVLDFDEEIENLSLFLEDVKLSGGGDGPEDFAGALSIALDQLSWRNGKKIIFWFANGPAHGKRFCYIPNHQEEEPKLVQLVERIAKEDYNFIGLIVKDFCTNERKKNTDDRTRRTFNEMRDIFYQYNSKIFKIEDIDPDSHIFDEIIERESSYEDYYPKVIITEPLYE